MHGKRALKIFWTTFILLGWMQDFLASKFPGKFGIDPKSWAYIVPFLIILDVIAFNWLLCDAEDNAIKLPFILRVFAIIAPFIAFPYYILRYKGAKKSIASFGLFILLAIASSAIIYALILLTLFVVIALYGV